MSVTKIHPMKELPCGEIPAELPLIRELLLVVREKDDNSEMDDCIEKLCEAFRKEELEISAVLGEIELWLWYFTGQSQTDKSADRCLLFFVKCSLRMFLEDTVTPPLFTLLLQHIENIQFSVCDISRYRCCRMITSIFEDIEEIEADYEPTSCKEESSLPREVIDNLVRILQGRMYDKNPFVRAEVIRSLCIFSRINDRNEDIIDALKDISRDVRIEAVHCVPLFSESDIQTFISTILMESDNNVRRLAFSRIACSLHVRSLSVQQRMQLLKTAFTSDDAMLRKITERMIMNWSGNDAVPLLSLLDHLDFLSDSQTSQQALMIFLKNYQRRIGSARTSVMLMNLRELCNAAQAKSVVTGMTRTAQCADFVSYDILDRRNYAEMRHSSNNNLYVIAGRIYLWRSLCEYCQLNAVDEADRFDSLHVLLPNMVDFVDFLYSSLATWTASANSVQGVLEECIIFQLCLLTRSFDQTDRVGMKKWQITLETIISTRDLPNSEKVLEFAVYELFDLFYAKEENVEEFLEWCCYRINSFFTPDLNETEELPLTRALLAKLGMEYAMSCGPVIENDNNYEPKSHNIQRALLLLRAIMRNSSTAKVTTFLRTAFDQVVDTYCTTLDPMIWTSLSEVIGIGVTIDGQIARERIHVLRSAIEVEGAPTRVKALALTSIAACAILRSYATTAQLYYPEIVDNCVVKGQMLLQVFEGFIFSEDAELSFAAVESIGKILYYRCLCFPSALAGLLLRYFDSSCQPYPYTFLNYFFSFYPASSSVNQHKLIGALRHALKVLDEAQDDGKLSVNVDANGMINFVAKTVKKSMLSNSAKKENLERTYPPQFFLISCLLDWTINNAEGNLSVACVGALAYTSPEEFSHNNKAYSHLLKLTTRCINVLFTLELDKLIPIIRRFERRLKHMERNEGDYMDDAKTIWKKKHIVIS
uniref:Cnd3 domain-containing protein n=1 Tax=Wuchereria bancrofti TaxID=6293 RepID=A0A1I8EBK6_WUCBA